MRRLVFFDAASASRLKKKAPMAAPVLYDWPRLFRAWGLEGNRLEQDRWLALFAKLPGGPEWFRRKSVLLLSDAPGGRGRMSRVCLSAELGCRLVGTQYKGMPAPGACHFDAVLMWDGWRSFGSDRMSVMTARAYSTDLLCIEGDAPERPGVSAPTASVVDTLLGAECRLLDYSAERCADQQRHMWVVRRARPTLPPPSRIPLHRLRLTRGASALGVMAAIPEHGYLARSAER